MSTARKTRPDSEAANLRQRAMASRASAARVVRGKVEAPAASPDLLAMVAEWEENMRLQNEGSLSDQEAEPVINRGDEVQRAVLAYPVRSIADLLAKVPVFRDELKHTGPPLAHEGKLPLDYVAWVGVIQDIERLARTATTPLTERCDAAHLGDLLEKAWVLRDRCDECVTPGKRDALSGLEDYAAQKVDDLQTGISFVRASSPAGMLIQIAVASGGLDLAVHGSTLAIREAASDRAERCLFSVSAALCAMTGIDREGLAAGRYLSPSCDQLATLSSEAVR